MSQIQSSIAQEYNMQSVKDKLDEAQMDSTIKSV